MTHSTCGHILNEVAESLGDRFIVEPSGTMCAVRTPFLYPDNSPITLFIREDEPGAIVVSDMGEASDYAFVHGIGERSINRRIRRVERRFNLDLGDDELVIRTDPNQLGDAVASIVNAVQDVGYLVDQRQRTAKNREFHADVERFLVQHHHRYERDVLVKGRARERKIDYQIDGRGPGHLYLWIFDPSSRLAERRADEISFSYIDVSRGAGADEQMEPARFAVLVNTRLNDHRRASLSTALETLNLYVPHVVPWENRHEIDALLDAA